MVVVGNCSQCNRKNVKVIRQMCSGCYQAQRKVVCAKCGECKVVGNKELNLCKRCCKKLAKEKCVLCGEVKSVDTRLEKGPICSSCRNKTNKGICSICGKENVIAINNGALVGKCCYENKARCVRCEEYKSICTRNINGEPICMECRLKEKNKGKFCRVCGNHANGRLSLDNLCYSCHCKSNKKTCEECNKFKADVFFNKRLKKLMCGYCVNKRFNMSECSNCGKMSLSGKKLEIGMLCQSCYKEECVVCGKKGSVYKRLPDNGCICVACGVKRRREEDVNFDIRYRIRCRLYQASKLYFEKGKTVRDKNIDFKGIIEHLGNCPGDRSEYHIDHIFPLAAFDLTNSDDFQIACHPENHQWLLAKENLTKQAYYDKQELVFFKKKIRKKIERCGKEHE